MTTLELPKGSIMVWRNDTLRSWDKGTGTIVLSSGTLTTWDEIVNTDTTIPSEHSRAPIAVANTRIENAKRMANGRMRKYIVAIKQTWSTSWALLPTESARTVDGKAGAKAIEDFYYKTQNSFILTIVSGDAGQSKDVSKLQHYEVMFSDFSKSIEKRGITDLWNVDLTMEEC